MRAGLVWAMGLLLVVAVVGALVLHGDARTRVVDGLGLVAVWISVGVCWLAVSRVGCRRAEVLLAAAAVTSFAAALTYYGAVVAGGGPNTFNLRLHGCSLSLWADRDRRY